MSKQLLFYEKAIPVSSQRHGDWYVKSGNNYAFSRETNSVPLTAVEIPHAAPEYPIVFAGTDEAIMPVVVLGVRDSENVYVDEDGSWSAKYSPAFVRRYPFVFSTSDDGKTFTLCIDEDFSGCNQEGLGERLFDAEGERTQYLGSVLNFLQEYQAQFKRTQLFCNKLKELDLLEPMQAKFTTPGGKQLAMSGFMAINREKLNGLEGETLSELAKSGELELAYLHLQSMRNFSAMLGRVSENGEKQEDTGIEETAEEAVEETAEETLEEEAIE
jgi:hypothetical protein